jgi:hypothetical protein
MLGTILERASLLYVTEELEFMCTQTVLDVLMGAGWFLFVDES